MSAEAKPEDKTKAIEAEKKKIDELSPAKVLGHILAVSSSRFSRMATERKTSMWDKRQIIHLRKILRTWNKKTSGDKFHSLLGAIGAVIGVSGYKWYTDRREKREKTNKEHQAMLAVQVKELHSFTVELARIGSEYNSLIDDMSEYRHNITLLSGVTPRTIDEFHEFQDRHKKIWQPTPQLADKVTHFFDSIGIDIKEDNIPKHLDNLLKDFKEEFDLIHVKKKQFTITQALIKLYIGNDSEIKKSLETIEYLRKVKVGSYFIATDPTEPEHLRYVRNAKTYKNELFEVLDAKLLMHTETTPSVSIAPIFKEIFEPYEASKVLLKHTDMPDFFYNRLAGHAMRCQANSIRFDPELAKTTAPDAIIAGDTPYDQWGSLAKHYLNKAIERNYDFAGVHHLMAVMTMRDVAVIKRLSSVAGIPAEEKAAYDKRLEELIYQALNEQDTALILDPKNTAYRITRGNIHTAREDYGRALVDSRRALELDPKNPNIRLLRAEIFSHLQKYKKARHQLHYVPAARNPEEQRLQRNYLVSGNTHSTIGNVFFHTAGKQGDLDRACYHARQAEKYNQANGITNKLGLADQTITRNARKYCGHIWADWIKAKQTAAQPAQK